MVSGWNNENLGNELDPGPVDKNKSPLFWG